MLDKTNIKTLPKEILSTLGPSSLNEKVINRLEDAGVSLFRINLSHTSIDDLPNVINEVRKYTSIPICLDTEGAQVRTGKLKQEYIHVLENKYMHIVQETILGDEEEICLFPGNVFDQLKVGDLISIDFNTVLVQVIDQDEIGWVVRVITGGQIGNNKAVSIDREIKLDPLTEKDKASIIIGLNLKIEHFALSFANHEKDVKLIRSLVGENRNIISKIETLDGISNLDGILEQTDSILIDRGDLSRQIPIEQIPRAQKEIIRQAKKKLVKCYVATNLLESMISQPNPTRAEVNDIFSTLEDGADGLVLAAETAIGKFPVSCAIMVGKLIWQFEEYSKNPTFLRNQNPSMNSVSIIEPHGGTLVNRIISYDESIELSNLPKVIVSLSDLINVEQIAIGTYSPLKGFLIKNEVESVLNEYSLLNGIVWTLPIMLQVSEDQIEGIKLNDSIALCLEGSEEIFAQMEISDIYSYDLMDLASRIFSTIDITHPGVKKLRQGGSFFLGGKVKMIKRLSSELKHYEITPRQARSIFSNKNWIRILGFHTRNVALRANEYIQNLGFEQAYCDGLFIHPLIGPRKTDNYLPEVIMRSYELIAEKYFQDKSMLIAAFQNYPRYAGPREAVFTAICHKNFGCSHFVLGQDHSLISDFYEPDATQNLFIKIGDIGIKPIFFDEVRYCKKCQAHSESCDHNQSAILKINAKDGQEILKREELLPEWYMRKEISDYLVKKLQKGKEIFTR